MGSERWIRDRSVIQRAFEVGFMIFLPFLVIDLVVASVLMAMGMMMVPPAIVSLPFKLAFFVLADGWSLLAGALVPGHTGCPFLLPFPILPALPLLLI